MVEAGQEHRAARDEVLSRPERAQTARSAAFGRVFGAEQVFRNRAAYLSMNPAQRAESASQTAKHSKANSDMALYDPGQHRATQARPRPTMAVVCERP